MRNITIYVKILKETKARIEKLRENSGRPAASLNAWLNYVILKGLEVEENETTKVTMQ